ncbi:MAG TPA: hypothetical protein VNJ08_10000 [Bacteriovoracaceae bacterium]|nr:hypothetical protein [Bacteriovoracaceae bacterium]
MRATLFLLLSFIILGAFLWIALSGALLALGAILWILGLVLAIGYSDTAILFFLGAREVRSGDESLFFEAAAQEAYKLAVPLPHLYFYNGSIERGFVLQNKRTISLVLSRTFLAHANPSELSAVCFELLLQVKKGMAPKRTKSLFILGVVSWIFHSIASVICTLVPIKEVNKAVVWILTYFLHPWLEFIFHLTMGRSYFKKLQTHMNEYPEENERLRRVGLKLRKPSEIYSLPSKKLMQFSSMSKSRAFQNILALELLPHEWDFFFNAQDMNSAQEV